MIWSSPAQPLVDLAASELDIGQGNRRTSEQIPDGSADVLSPTATGANSDYGPPPWSQTLRDLCAAEVGRDHALGLFHASLGRYGGCGWNVSWHLALDRTGRYLTERRMHLGGLATNRAGRCAGVTPNALL